MNYILATIAEIKSEVQYRLWASQSNDLADYDSFGEFLLDAQWYSRKIIDDIKSSAK